MISLLLLISISGIALGLPQNLLSLPNLPTENINCVNITFYYAQRGLNQGPTSLVKFDGKSLPHGYSSDWKTVFLAHGFTRSCTSTANSFGVRQNGVYEAVDAYLQLDNGHSNVFCIDWSPLAGDTISLTNPEIFTDYYEASKNTELVGKCAAKFIQNMEKNFALEYEKVIVQGHSLGSFVAEHLGCNLNQGNQPLLPLLIGVDPAGPVLPFSEATSGNILAKNPVNGKCSKSARVTQMVYTSYFYGSTATPRGDVVFQMNLKNLHQPFCMESFKHDVPTTTDPIALSGLYDNMTSCDHNIVVTYMNEAVILGPESKLPENKGFYGCQTPNSLLSQGKAPLMGPYMDLQTPHGIYQVKTRSSRDFSEGNNCQQISMSQ
jgi:pimeloyl-ACP methyl ester carboxylesterase